MPIIPWRPWLGRSWEEFDDLLANRLPEIKKVGFMPPVDIYEKGNNLVVETQVPGVDPEKVDVSVENNVLILKGASEKKSEVDEKNYYRREVSSGSFYRSLPLPIKVMGDKAQAVYEDGLLKVIIPKAAPVKIKKIAVKIKKSKK